MSAKALNKIEEQRITVVIPAYNEGQRIAEVVRVTSSTRWVDEVLVVDDGSADDTPEVAWAGGATVISMQKNAGKGAALQRGITETLSRTDIFLFLDADLLGLNKLHLRQLVRPLLYDEDLVMTIGKFASGRLTTNISQFVLPILNGQRALRAEFVAGLPDLSDYRYGVEVLLSKIAESGSLRTKEVRLKGLAQVIKEEKQGVVRGTMQRYKMYYECLDAWRKYLSDQRKLEKRGRGGKTPV